MADRLGPYDVIIAGGGIAGLSAALILGRCRRNVLVCDTNKPRNRVSQALHGFLSRNGIHPLEMRRIAREQLQEYPSVSLREIEITAAEPLESGYRVLLADGRSADCSYLLVATGIVDQLPDVPGVAEMYGRSVFHCPYCDGWEMRDQPLAVYGCGEDGAEFSLELINWSNDIVLCLDGGELPKPKLLERLERNGISIRREKIARLEGDADGRLRQIVFKAGPPLARRALFFSPGQMQASPLAESLGCSIVGGMVETSKFQRTQPRMFVAGDAARSVQLAIVAAAEGVEAAFAINSALLKERLK